MLGHETKAPLYKTQAVGPMFCLWFSVWVTRVVCSSIWFDRLCVMRILFSLCYWPRPWANPDWLDGFDWAPMAKACVVLLSSHVSHVCFGGCSCSFFCICRVLNWMAFVVYLLDFSGILRSIWELVLWWLMLYIFPFSTCFYLFHILYYLMVGTFILCLWLIVSMFTLAHILYLLTHLPYIFMFIYELIYCVTHVLFIHLTHFPYTKVHIFAYKWRPPPLTSGPHTPKPPLPSPLRLGIFLGDSS